jgi:hypothetical protein
VDQDDRPGRHAGSGTCTCSRPSSRTSTGPTRRCAQEFEDILRFWFDRGVDGVRIDSAALLAKDPALPDPRAVALTDRDDVHDIYRAWRRSPTNTPAGY